MLLEEAISLINNANIDQGQPATWADLGCGSGMFTRALSSTLPANSTIIAVDNMRPDKQIVSVAENVTIHFQQGNFEKDNLQLPLLNGILMANSLHYIADKNRLLHHLKTYLQPEASFIIVEYDTTQRNHWVPYPINKIQLQQLFREIGFINCSMLGQRPSLYQQGDLYACQFSR